jgi:hypothetical protein
MKQKLTGATRVPVKTRMPDGRWVGLVIRLGVVRQQNDSRLKKVVGE